MEIITKFSREFLESLGIDLELCLGYYYTKPNRDNTLFYFGIDNRSQYKLKSDINLNTVCKELNRSSKAFLSKCKKPEVTNEIYVEGETKIQAVNRLSELGFDNPVSMVYNASTFDYIGLVGEFELYDDCGLFGSLSEKCLFFPGGYLIPREAGYILGGYEIEEAVFDEYPRWNLKIKCYDGELFISIQMESNSNWVLDYKDTTYFKDNNFALRVLGCTYETVLTGSLEECKQVGKWLRYVYSEGKRSSLRVIKEKLDEELKLNE